tara:strand:+ start:8856 stop:10094 length:1239 start_codon:yes stop_codon:yes gene_type:complete
MINVEFDRRNFMQIGGISAGLSAMGLSDANAASLPNNEKSVVWLWLGGGATHIETFDPKPLAPEGVRSVNGSIMTNGDFLLGGNFLKLATRSDKISVVRSFAHRNSSHRTGTHWVMTGHNSTDNTPQSMQQEPSYGSIVSSVYGANHPENGMPSYVKVNGISFDGPAWLGGQAKPYEASGEGVKNLKSRVEANRFLDRKNLVKGFDKLKLANNSELWSDLRKQSYGLLLGNASEAFDLDKEPQPSRDKYGKGLGEQMLLARRLVENGTKFVTIQYGGWDMHGNIGKSLDGRMPPLDHALSTFIDDVHAKGMSKNILLVVTGEFGRTYRVNKNGGRDHWPQLSPLMLSGGDFEMGRVIGESTSKAETPKSDPLGPKDVTATLFAHLQIDPEMQKIDFAGRPRYFVDSGAKVIL